MSHWAHDPRRDSPPRLSSLFLLVLQFSRQMRDFSLDQLFQQPLIDYDSALNGASDSNDLTEGEIIAELADRFHELEESVTQEDEVMDYDELVIQPTLAPALARRSTRST